jgi:hypothetical protein
LARAVDPKRTRKAKRLIERLKAAGEATDYSAREDEFLREVDTRLDRFGSAFRDLAKGAPDDAVSRLQAQKLKEIAQKAAGKPARRGLARKSPLRAKRAKPS